MFGLLHRNCCAKLILCHWGQRLQLNLTKRWFVETNKLTKILTMTIELWCFSLEMVMLVFWNLISASKDLGQTRATCQRNQQKKTVPQQSLPFRIVRQVQILKIKVNLVVFWMMVFQRNENIISISVSWRKYALNILLINEIIQTK